MILLFSLFRILLIPSALALVLPPSQSNLRILGKGDDGTIPTDVDDSLLMMSNSNCQPKRRDVINKASSLAFMLLSGNGKPSVAVSDEATNNADTSGAMVSASTLASRLHAVPTFTIVDKSGVPFMVVGEDARVTGYFFTTYNEAARILKLARDSVEKDRKTKTKEELNELGPNPWKEGARISTVPLDAAVTLVTASKAKGKSRAYFLIAPAEDDIQDALALDKSGKDELPEGRVPLFYFEDFSITTTNKNTNEEEKQSPLYFRKSELISDWKKQNPNKDVPDVLVSELFSVIGEMVTPGKGDEDLKRLVFVPPKESLKKAKECLRAGGSESAFKVGQSIIVL